MILSLGIGTIMTTNNIKIGPIGIYSLFAYCTSVFLIIFVGARLQYYSLNIGLVITEIVLIGLPAGLVLFMHRKAVDWKQFSMPNPRQFFLTALIGVCATAIAVYKGITIRKILVGIDTSGTDVTGGMSFLIIILIAPLCEELLFRPVIQNGLARYCRARTVVIITALLFALFHLTLLRFAETFIIGLFAGIVFLKTKRFWCAVVVHFLCNALGPILWKNAGHLKILLNPATAIALACVAFTSCYFLGEKSSVELKGIRQHINWALFGTKQNNLEHITPSRYISLFIGVIVISLAALLGYGHAIMTSINIQSHSYVVSERDMWNLLPTNRIHASSQLHLSKIPKTYEDLVINVPFEKVVVESVKYKNSNVPFFHMNTNKYRIDLSSYGNGILNDTITVIWSFPIDCLTQTDYGYQTPLCSLVPSNALSVRLGIAQGSDFQFTSEAEKHERLLFRMSTDKPRVVYGSCNIMIEKKRNK